MKRLALLIGFFLTTPTLILVASFFLFFLSYQQKTSVLGASVFANDNKKIAYAALPGNINTVSDSIDAQDARIGRVAVFLASYNSPLTQYAGLIVATADKYGIDYRLLPAIGAQESGDCTKGRSTEWKNCWGYGVYGKKVTQFQSYQDAIDTITRYFANKKSNGVDTLEEIGAIYNPSDHNNWKANVASFMNQL